MRAIVIVLLALEGGVTLLRTANLVYTLAAYDPIALTLIVARAFVAMALVASAWLIANDALPARAIARAAVIASAVLYVFDGYLALAPSVVPAFYRGPFVLAYWCYAAVVFWRLRDDR